MWLNLVAAAACLWLVALSGCGNDSPVTDTIFDPDAPAYDPDQPCNPINQTGCRVGRCTWNFNQARTWCNDDVATVSLGQPCALTSEGFDDCMAGLICLQGVCREICGVYQESGGNTCTTQTTCDDISPIFTDENVLISAVLSRAGACGL